jgi:hypothetical protein
VSADDPARWMRVTNGARWHYVLDQESEQHLGAEYLRTACNRRVARAKLRPAAAVPHIAAVCSTCSDRMHPTVQPLKTRRS